MGAGRPKKYAKKALKAGIDRYFRSISRTVDVTDLAGKTILNDDGEAIKHVQYLIPPSKSALCLYLGIDRSTWQNYAEQYPDVCSAASAKIEAYLEEQLLTRQKGVQGVIFNLQNNYGWRQKQEVEIGKETRQAMRPEMDMEEKLRLIRAAGIAQAEDGVCEEEKP